MKSMTIDIASIPQCANEKVPAPTRPFKVALEVQTRFNDYDSLGHANNNSLMAYYDLGKVDYFRSILQFKGKLEDMNLVVVNINVNFYSPAFPDEPLVVLTAATRLSLKSVTMEQRIVNPISGDVKSCASTVLAGFNPHTSQGAPINPVDAAKVINFEGL